MAQKRLFSVYLQRDVIVEAKDEEDAKKKVWDTFKEVDKEEFLENLEICGVDEIEDHDHK